MYIFFDVSTQIGYFNTGFVSLRYKNATQILIHFDKNMQEKSTIFLKIFWKLFFSKIFDVLMKTGYFNTGFVSLQYKNTNRY